MKQQQSELMLIPRAFLFIRLLFHAPLGGTTVNTVSHIFTFPNTPDCSKLSIIEFSTRNFKPETM